jgi:hypothetical protein
MMMLIECDFGLLIKKFSVPAKVTDVSAGKGQNICYR